MKATSKLLKFLCGALLVTAPCVARAESASSAKSSKSKKSHAAGFTGWVAPESQLRSRPPARPSGNIVISSVNDPKNVVSVNIYNADGSFNQDALDQLNHVWRCRRTQTEKQIDPHLFEVVSHVYDRFQKPLTLVSGFRNQPRTTSFHYAGSASDLSVPGVPDSRLKAFVESLDTGGMGIGIYPHAGFIHVDIRPEPSYRWVDRAAAGSTDSGQPKTRPRSPNS
ncbi:MAG TPA: DUF882 domain-containing protein [Pseudomonadota bacterium]|nr:DUF882 domain-containing protein [Pseudomonadota bacterium]